MAGTVTVKEQSANASGDSGRISHKIEWTITSDASGDADLITSKGPTLGRYTGACHLCITKPGSTAPTDNWDLVINDADGEDVLQGNGANRDTADDERIVGYGFVHDSTLNLVASNMGNAKDAVVTLYISPTI